MIIKISEKEVYDHPNFFLFRDALYLQLQDTAMGAVCAPPPRMPTYSLWLWERSVFLGEASPRVEHIHLWGRYIDDIIFLWQGFNEGLTQLMHSLNINDYNIRLTYKTSKTKMEFLDVLCEVDTEGFIHSDLYRKDTSVNSFLHARSAHPKHLIDNIPTGQFLRI